MRTAIRSDAPSASASGSSIVVRAATPATALRPVDERVEHERDERDRRRHDRGPRDPLQAGPVRARSGPPAPHEVADDADDRARRSPRSRSASSETVGLAIDEHRREHRPTPRTRARSRPGAASCGASRRGARARGAGRPRGGSATATRAHAAPSRAVVGRRRCGRGGRSPNSATAPTNAPAAIERGERLAAAAAGATKIAAAPHAPTSRAATTRPAVGVVGGDEREHHEHRRPRSASSDGAVETADHGCRSRASSRMLGSSSGSTVSSRVATVTPIVLSTVPEARLTR